MRNENGNANTEVLGVITGLVFMACEVDIGTLVQSKHLNDAMLVIRDSTMHVHEKDLNSQIVSLLAHLVMGRNTRQLVWQYLDTVTVGLLCSCCKQDNKLIG